MVHLQRFTWLTALLLIGFLLTACHPNISITYENRTDSTIRVDVRTSDDQQPAFDEVEAGLTRTINYLAGDRYEITVVTEDGRVLFHEVFTEDELEEIGNLIIIDEPASSRLLIPEATNALPP